MRESVRTFWKGHLRLALVNIPIRLVSAERADAEIHFHQVDRKSHQRIKYVKMAPGRGEVAKDDIVMAYEVEPGNYVFMEDKDLDSLKLSSRHTVELTQFVDQDEIDPLYFERPYYVLPDGDVAEEGYSVIRDALKASKKIGIGQLTLRGRENLVALYPGGNGMVLDTLRYESELKDADDVFAGLGKASVSKDMEEMAQELIAKKSGPFDASRFKNHYADALRELVSRKLSKGQSVAVENDEEQGGKVIDFMDALKRSLGNGEPGEKPARKAAPAAPKKPAKKTVKRRA
ncbi:Ku protein [Aestuariivirga sp.]|uniref:non-homologous end joining protein Ku n=1 Tax=Aestuariivirga sp. TaxID=2650926 RepID=UPI0039E67A80